MNEQFALNTVETRKLVERNQVVTIKADKTRENPAIDKLLRLLGNPKGTLPFYAIFPADNPNKPIIFADGIVTQSQILEALEKAGPSKPTTRTALRNE